ncbi:MAG: hypothetical protein RIS47_1602, partial [Bacteroidota bacterium]
KIDFKVVEFAKASKRIVLSHTRVWEDEKNKNNDSKPRLERSEKSDKTDKTDRNDKAVADKNKQKTVKKVKINIEKTTFGDIADLAALKTQLEEEEAAE